MLNLKKWGEGQELSTIYASVLNIYKPYKHQFLQHHHQLYLELTIIQTTETE